MPSKPNGKFTRIAVALTCIAMLVAAVTFTVRGEMTAREALQRCDDHEMRIRTLERAIGEMAADIRVIREIMEHPLHFEKEK